MLALVLTGLYSRIFQTREMLNCAVANRNATVAAALLSSEDLFLDIMTPPLIRAELKKLFSEAPASY